MTNTSLSMGAGEVAALPPRASALPPYDAVILDLGLPKIDGLTLIQAKGQPALNLTVAQIYKALAANPFGKPQTAQTWKDIDPSLPATKIRVLGPPPTSGTRDSLAELILEKGCDSNEAMKALKKSDDKAHKETCTKIREDGAYVEAGENDNLLVQKVSADPGALDLIRRGAERVVEVSDDEVAEAIRILFSDTHSAAEGAGAAPLAGFIKNRSPREKKVAVILTGQNIDRPLMQEVLAGRTPRVA